MQNRTVYRYCTGGLRALDLEDSTREALELRFLLTHHVFIRYATERTYNREYILVGTEPDRGTRRPPPKPGPRQNHTLDTTMPGRVSAHSGVGPARGLLPYIKPLPRVAAACRAQRTLCTCAEQHLIARLLAALAHWGNVPRTIIRYHHCARPYKCTARWPLPGQT